MRCLLELRIMFQVTIDCTYSTDGICGHSMGTNIDTETIIQITKHTEVALSPLDSHFITINSFV